MHNTDELKTIERFLALTLKERAEITTAIAMCYPKLQELNRHEDFKSRIVAAFPEYVEYEFILDLIALSLTPFNFATGEKQKNSPWSRPSVDRTAPAPPGLATQLVTSTGELYTFISVADAGKVIPAHSP